MALNDLIQPNERRFTITATSNSREADTEISVNLDRSSFIAPGTFVVKTGGSTYPLTNISVVEGDDSPQLTGVFSFDSTNNPLGSYTLELSPQLSDLAGNFSVNTVLDTFEVTDGISNPASPELNTNAYFVAPTGSDSNDGSEGSPFQTLEAAQAAVRADALHQVEPITVYLRGGRHSVTNQVQFSSVDSGASGAPVVYRNYPGESPEISGGYLLSGFSNTVPPELTSVFPNPSIVWSRSLTPTELSYFGQIAAGKPLRTAYVSPYEISWNKQPMHVCRYPSFDFANKSQPTWMKVAADGPNRTTVQYVGTRPDGWANPTDAMLCGSFKHSWSIEYHTITALNTGTSTITLGQNHGYDIDVNSHFFVCDLPEELTDPYEFWVDRTNSVLYIIPPTQNAGEIAAATVEVAVPTNHLFQFTDCDYVQFEGIEFSHTRGEVFNIPNCNNTLIKNCEFHNIGSLVIHTDGGSNNEVSGCYIHDVTAGGVRMTGGDEATLTPTNNLLSNTKVEAFNKRWDCSYRGAAHLEGVGQIVRNCEFFECMHLALEFRGNDHLIELNKFHRLLLFAADSGSCYAGRDVTWRGTQFKNNHFYNSGPWIDYAASLPMDANDYPNGITGSGNRKFAWSYIYFDDFGSGLDVVGNIFQDADRGAWFNGGQANLFQGNLTLGRRTGVFIANRNFVANGRYDAPNGDFYLQLIDDNYLNPPYSNYRFMVNTLDNDPTLPVYNSVIHNAYSSALESSEAGLQGISSGAEGATYEELPLSADAATAVQQLADNPSYTNNTYGTADFPTIPFANIGLTPEFVF